MRDLSEAVALIALEIHPDRISAICSALTTASSHDFSGIVKSYVGIGCPSQLISQFDEALAKNPVASGSHLALMFQAASMTATLAARFSSSELVWTGPQSGLVPVRHTEQVLIGLIDSAKERLFVVSFVAFSLPAVQAALGRAMNRGVSIQFLLELSDERGGKVSTDSFKLLKSHLPNAVFYRWDQTLADNQSKAAVHAKCAVADGREAFITSANLTSAAMERNIEIGVLFSGGSIPDQLERQLMSLVNTKHFKPA